METPILQLDSNAVIETARLGEKLSFLEHEQLPFALTLAINRTLSYTRDFIRERMPEIFDRPTRFTINSMFIRSATKQTLTGEIAFKRTGSKYEGVNPQSYLYPETEGTDRPQKKSEFLMSSEGIIDSDEVIAPSQAAPRNEYGNVPIGLQIRMFSGLKLYMEQGYLMNKSRTGRLNPNNDFFYGIPAHHSNAVWAIWKRGGKSLVPIYFKLKHAHYGKTFPFKAMVEGEAMFIMDREFAKAWEFALSTARLK